MVWWEFAIWGIVGGVLIDGLELRSAARRNGGPLPAEYTGRVYWTGEVFRLLAGGAVAMALGLSDKLGTPVAALGVGISTPLILERLRSPLHKGEERTAAGSAEPSSDHSNRNGSNKEQPD